MSDDSQVSLTRDSLVNTGSSYITQYKINRATSSGGTYTNIAHTTELNYFDTTVSSRITYYYVITAVNSDEESSCSSEVSSILATTTTASSTDFCGIVIILSSSGVLVYILKNEDPKFSLPFF